MTMQALEFFDHSFISLALMGLSLWGGNGVFSLFSMAKVEEVSKAKSGGGEKVS